MKPYIAALLALSCLAAPAVAQQAYTPVEQRLTAEQMSATGLDRLSSEQLALLNRLLRDERAAAIDKAASEARQVARAEAPREKASREAFESRIQGEFRGWTVGTVFTLANGQRWRVVNGSYDARAIANPVVRLRPGLVSGWYMQVQGHSPSATVRLLD